MGLLLCRCRFIMRDILLLCTDILHSVLVTLTACPRRATITSRESACSLLTVLSSWLRPMLLSVVLILLRMQNGSGWVPNSETRNVIEANDCLLFDSRDSCPMCPFGGWVLILTFAASRPLGLASIK